MAELIPFVASIHEADLRELWTAYLEESADDLKRELGFEEDIPAAVADTLGHLDQFAPPAGRLLVVVEEGVALGCGCLRAIVPGVAEIKRMYLRPAARGQGLGRQLLEALLDEARRTGYREARLDTDGLMPAAVGLYHKVGFVPCALYPESEIPAQFHDRWLFMRLDLTGDASAFQPTQPVETPEDGGVPQGA
jgi:carbonic anhydrase